MAWNTPAGNQDIIYFIFTLYNISSTRAADYVGVRPAMREILLDEGARISRTEQRGLRHHAARDGLSGSSMPTSPSRRTWMSAKLT